ncbi:hypothetical protein SAMN04488589_1346 [Methanolobus vulcani]|uniref:Uncharacterized protein n=1 Tax=Methanolobus vulcani TaxID=38026 RepID=A0A7Z7AZ64_9EURY|nr:hypothetical protein [Methanolobus vulcani]SDF79544.1 hypothetical protein SAMN04488589_1346 [Methanolobus vulcani]
MKRLTISMSDELFDKLDVIENKSLFIRKLIERELDAVENFSSEEVVPWSEGFSILKKDVNTIFSRLEEMESKLAGMNTVHENEPLMQESLNSMEQDIPESFPELQDNLTQTIDTHESQEPIPIDKIPAENTSTPDIIEGISADHTNIPVLIETDVGITLEDVQESAINEPYIESVKTEEPVISEIQNSEQTMPANLPEAADTAPLFKTSIQEPTPMEIAITEEQIIPDKSTLLNENNEAVVSPSIPETEVQNEGNDEISREHKLSELVAERINQETELETNDFKEPEISPSILSEQNATQPEFKMPEFKSSEQETQQQEFKMPEFKTPEQEAEPAEFQMPELKLPESDTAQTDFKMPEIKPPEQEMGQMEFQMPEFKIQEQEIQQPEFQMPEFKTQEQEIQQPEFQMPEFKTQEQEIQQPEFQMPEFKTQEQEIQQPEFQMPEFKTQEQEIQQPEFQMPEFKTQEQEIQQPEFQMSEFKTPEQEIQQPEFQMPEFKTQEQEIGQTAFAIPELQTPETAPLFPANDTESAMQEMKTPEILPVTEEAMPPFNAGPENIPEMQSTEPQMQNPGSQNNTNNGTGTKPDKLETNILMYMPRGAKVKKEIIKSLVSRQFSQEDIDKKIQELVAREILILKQENGVEQLHRLK